MDSFVEKFDDYLEGELSPDEVNALEQQLATDPALAKELELHKAARDVVAHAGQVKKFRLEIEKALEAEGFFEQFKKEQQHLPIYDTWKTMLARLPRWSWIEHLQPYNRWKWAIYILPVLLAAGAFWHIFKDPEDTGNQKSGTNQEIAQGDTSIAKAAGQPNIQTDKNSSAMAQKEEKPKISRSESPKTKLPAIVSNQERSIISEDKIWPLNPQNSTSILEKLRDDEQSLLTPLGSDDTDWSSLFLARNYAKAKEMLLDKVTKDPENASPTEYYILGIICLLYDRLPAEAVRFLEKAEGCERKDYNKFMLMAYLENKQYDMTLERKSYFSNRDAFLFVGPSSL